MPKSLEQRNATRRQEHKSVKAALAAMVERVGASYVVTCLGLVLTERPEFDAQEGENRPWTNAAGQLADVAERYKSHPFPLGM